MIGMAMTRMSVRESRLIWMNSLRMMDRRRMVISFALSSWLEMHRALEEGGDQFEGDMEMEFHICPQPARTPWRKISTNWSKAGAFSGFLPP